VVLSLGIHHNNNPLYSFVDKPLRYASQQLTRRTALINQYWHAGQVQLTTTGFSTGNTNGAPDHNPVSIHQKAPHEHIADISLLLNLSTWKGRKAKLAWLADLQRTVYPHKWSPVSCRSSAGHGKFAGYDRRSTAVLRNQPT